MKNILCLLLIVFHLGCGKQQPDIIIPPDSDLHFIESVDMNAILQIYLPETMDSSATWNSDCCTGGQPTTCIWDRNYPFVKTMHGMCLPSHQPDSICQVTVYINRSGKIKRTMEETLAQELKHSESLQYDAYRRSIKWDLAEVRRIGPYECGVLAFKGFIGNSWVNELKTDCAETLVVMTSAYDTQFYIFFECAGSDCAGFINKMLPYVETIRIAPKNILPPDTSN